MNHTLKLTLLIPSALFFLSALPVAVPAATEAPCVELVRNNCLACHQETRICQKINKNKGERSWKRTIKSMVRNGAKVNKNDQKQLATCLSAPDAGLRTLCPGK